MQILHEIWILSTENPDSKTPKIDKRVSHWICQVLNTESSHVYGMEKQQDVIRVAREAYTWAVGNGLAKEQARAVLPEGNTVSRLYMNGTLRSWIHFIELRSGHGTQLEHQDVARACAQVIAQVFPMAAEFVGED
jgi:flavin-dependent thymidylate synthase